MVVVVAVVEVAPAVATAAVPAAGVVLKPVTPVTASPKPQENEAVKSMHNLASSRCTTLTAERLYAWKNYKASQKKTYKNAE